MGDGDCDDGSFCNGPETCVEGSCVGGKAPSCDDAVDCTVDSCDDTRGECLNAPDDSVCGCGETGAFMLEAGISSTLHSARTWDLLDPTITMAPRKHVPAKGGTAGPGSVGQMIDDALRAAGLLRHG